MRFLGRAAYQGDPALADSVVRPVAEVMRAMMMEILKKAAMRGEIRDDVDLDATAEPLIR